MSVRPEVQLDLSRRSGGHDREPVGRGPITPIRAPFHQAASIGPFHRFERGRAGQEPTMARISAWRVESSATTTVVLTSWT